MEGSEEDNSLSSPAPLSPPQNNKRIGSYFTPKETSRQPISRNLFETKQVMSSQPLEAHSDHSVASSHSLDMAQFSVMKSPQVSLEGQESVQLAESHSQLSFFDSRSKDIHTLLITRDKRIKELEHVIL